MSIYNMVIRNIREGIKQGIAYLCAGIRTMLHQIGTYHAVNPNCINIIASIWNNRHLHFTITQYSAIARRHHPTMFPCQK